MARRLPVRLLQYFLWAIAGWLLLTSTFVLALRWIDPPVTAFILIEARAGAKAAKPYRIRHQWVDADQISAHAKVAVIAAEDQRFPNHFGFDLKSINDALEDRQRGRRIRGASTITQQVSKNLFLWPGQSWVRKGLEAYFTVLIELLWSKERILTVYLNVAEFGRGVFGVGAASEVFFDKPAAGLTAPQAALLAAVLPSPKRMRVDSPSRYVRSRQQWIQDQMRSLGGTDLLRQLE